MFSLSNKKALSQRLSCIVNLLNPGEDIQVDYTSNSTGQDILNDLVSKLELPDKDYYGLRLHDRINWIDLSKTIVKQTKGMENVVFDLRFKYYPAEPALLASEATRYFLYLQLRSDLLEGRLRTDDQESIAFLIACIIQSELGDYNLDEHKSEDFGNYVSDFKFVPNQTEQLELEALKLHQSEDFLGLKPADSELNFLKKASRLDMYGIDPYPVRDGNSRNHLLIGVNHLGITTFQDSKKVNQFTWADIDRIALDNRLVLIYCKKVDKKGSKTRPLFGFRCASSEHAQSFWKLATEQRYFFTLENTPSEPIVTSSGGLFRKSHKVRYSGRVEKDLLRDDITDDRRGPLKRSHSLLSKSFTDRPEWQEFEQGKNLHGSLRNIYANDLINRTMPSNLGCFREEEEHENNNSNNQNNTNNNQDLDGKGKPNVLARKQSKSRPSIGSIATASTTTTTTNKDNGAAFTGRKSTLITKTDYQSKYNNNNDKQNSLENETSPIQDVIFISIFMISVVCLTLIGILMIDQEDRPSSINYLVKKANLEPVSKLIRENLFGSVKTSVNRLISQVNAMP